MIVWFLVGIAVLALAGWAFWPRQGGVSHAAVRRARQEDKGVAESYRRLRGPNIGGRRNF